MGTRAEIFTEGGGKRGYGHVARCIALAQGLLFEGIPVRMWVDGDIPATLKLHAIEWVAEEWHAGSDEIVVRLGDGYLLVVDSYLAPLSTYRSLSARAARSLYVDDSGRLQYPPGIILNPAPSAEVLPTTRPGETLLLGPAYQPLREPFWNNAVRETRRRVQAVVITLGGGAPPQVISDIAGATAREFPSATVYTVGVPTTDSRPGIVEVGLVGAEEMAGLMEQCDAAVSAGGQTLLELAAKGVPVVAVQTAENQVGNIAGLVDSGCALSAGSMAEQGIAGRVQALLNRLVDPRVRKRMSQKSQALLDGKGTQRVARALAYGYQS
jgi:UDP-2,4-diacetamido-2,4,6-trideoxy-beta-L-altropyranose hydrolase